MGFQLEKYFNPFEFKICFFPSFFDHWIFHLKPNLKKAYQKLNLKFSLPPFLNLWKKAKLTGNS